MAVQPLTPGSAPKAIAGQQWSACDYTHHAGFVAELAEPLLEWLAPQPGEQVLDLGCGDGRLTQKIAETGAKVEGADASAEMVAAARARGLSARVADAQALSFDAEFDAVFSNAALHWMKRDPDAVLTGVFNALRPGGRFVAEMGARGNCEHVRDAIRAVLAERGAAAYELEPWYFPAPCAYSNRLRAAGFSVEKIEWYERPTTLPGDVRDWLQTFGQWFISLWPEPQRQGLVEDIRERLVPDLLHDDHWVLDYVRLRFVARRGAPTERVELSQ